MTSGCDDATWVPDAAAVIARVVLLAEFRVHGIKQPAAKNYALPLPAHGVQLSQLALGSSDARAPLAWHQFTALTRWEVINTAHLLRVVPNLPQASSGASVRSSGDATGAKGTAGSHSDLSLPPPLDSAKVAPTASKPVAASAKLFAQAAAQQQHWLKLYGLRMRVYTQQIAAIVAAFVAQATPGVDSSPLVHAGAHTLIHTLTHSLTPPVLLQA
jgi:hypothetical protein